MTRKAYILGSGSVAAAKKLPGTVYVDHRPFPGVDLVLDLEKTPWPIPDGGALHVNVTHVLEHLTNFSAFMDECWRICSPGGSLFFEVPDVRSADLAFSDPDHKRYFTPHTFINYLTVEGIHKHGQFRHAWTFVHLEKVNGVIRGHLFPVPDECLTDESIAMWQDYVQNYSHDAK